jgi:hypothetical protein
VRIDLADAIKMYADACCAWYGGRARKVALRRAQELRRQGDLEGVKVWEQLASELAHRERASAGVRLNAGASQIGCN